MSRSSVSIVGYAGLNKDALHDGLLALKTLSNKKNHFSQLLVKGMS